MVKEVYAKSVLNKHKKRDSWFLDDYSINPYVLCGFNCIYCYIRGSKYGANMREELAVKVNAPSLLRKELRRRAEKKEYGFIALSSSTEPWQQVEERYKITRRCLEVIGSYRFPIHVLTKSDLVLRDLDLIRQIDENARLPTDLAAIGRGALITFSLSTLDEDVAKVFEPGSPAPQKRLDALKTVLDEEFFAGIAYVPVLPYISDEEEHLEEMAKAAKDVGARYVFFGSLTLFGVGKRMFFEALSRKFPELLPKYEALFGASHQLSFRYQRKLEKKAKEFCEKYGVKYGILL